MTVAIEHDISQLIASLDLTDDNPGVFCGEWVETSGPRIDSINPATGSNVAKACRNASAPGKCS